MRNRLWAALLAGVVAATVLSGCGSDGSDDGDRADTTPPAASTTRTRAPASGSTSRPPSVPPRAPGCEEWLAAVADASALLADADGADPASLDAARYQAAVQDLTQLRPTVPAAVHPHADWLLAELRKVSTTISSGGRYRFDIDASTRAAASTAQTCGGG